MAQILLVEDDATIRIPLTKALMRRGHAVTTVSTGAETLRRVTGDQYDVVILDLGLPDIDGVQVLQMLRGTSQIPVIVETARDDDTDIVRTLDLGADDYVVKPFTAQQLDARIRAVLRRTASPGDDETIQIDDLVIEPLARRVELGKTNIELSAREFDVLLYLARRAGTVVPKSELLSQVWHKPSSSNDRTVDVHLSWVRRKLGETAAEPRLLHTVRGAGVMLGGSKT